MAAKGETREAYRCEARALALWRARRGADAPESLRALANLALLSRNSGNLAGALELQREHLERASGASGPLDAVTLQSRRMLVLILARVGKRREALAVVEEGLRLLPADHRKRREFEGLRREFVGPAGSRAGGRGGKGKGKGKGKAKAKRKGGKRGKGKR